MSSWNYHQQLRVQRSRAMFAMVKRALRRLRDFWRHSRVAWHLKQVA
jgi:hypothetical protein